MSLCKIQLSGSCSRETKTLVESNNDANTEPCERTKQPPLVRRFLLCERCRAYMLSQVAPLSLFSSPHVNRSDLGGTGPLMVGHFQYDHTLLESWLAGSVNWTKGRQFGQRLVISNNWVLTVSIRSFHPTLGETMKIVTWGTGFDKFTVFLTTNEKRIRLDDDRISEAGSH